MRIGVIGTGNMGRCLGLLWAEQGHEVLFGARNVAKAEAAASLSANGAGFGTNDEAAAFGDVLFYNIRDVDPKDVISDVSVLDGKVLIESNNTPIPLDMDFPPVTRSGSEVLQEQVPGARVVKAFNTIPLEVFELCPDDVKRHDISVFVAGDDEDARETTKQLVTQIGFTPIDCGGLIYTRQLESLADLFRAILISNGVFGHFSIHALTPADGEPRLGGRDGGVDSDVVAQILAAQA